ncbi:MAG: MFS transporter [Candidatus Pacebacteria bacterium]|nr:MFS transporter [Candidatus Paceibacterota bacterium]
MQDNRSLEFFYLHNSLKTLGEVCAGSFFLAYFYKQGFTFLDLALTMAGVFALRFTLRKLLLPLMERTDLRNGLIIGTLLFPFRYLAAFPVHTFGAWLFVFIFSFALAESIYFTYYHAYWVSVMGRTGGAANFGTREALAQVVQVLGSVVSGYLLATHGALLSFGAGALFALFSCIPLFALPKQPPAHKDERPEPRAESIARLRGILIAEGFFSAGMGIMWPIVLFTAADSDFLGFGVLLAIAALLYALGDYLLGKHFDAIPKHWLAATGALLMFVDLTGRAIFGVTPEAIIGFNVLASIASVAYYMAHSQMSYGCIRESGYPLKAAWHHETSWDIGAVAGLLIAAGIIALGISPRVTLIMCAFGALGAGWFMFRYYRPAAVLKESAASITA